MWIIYIIPKIVVYVKVIFERNCGIFGKRSINSLYISKIEFVDIRSSPFKRLKI